MDYGIDFEQYDSHTQKLSVTKFVATIAVPIPSIHWYSLDSLVHLVVPT